MTLTARQVAERIAAHVGAPPRATTVDGFLAGNPDTPVTGVAVTVMATLDVLRRAARRGLGLVITHEPLYFDHHGATEDVLAEEADPVFATKAAFIAEHGLVVLHLHDAWHDRQPDGILTGTARALGWLDAERVGDPGVYDLPPTTLGDLAAHVAQSLRARALRYVGDPSAPVATVGLQPGFQGFERNRHLLARPDVDAIVIGEGHEWETGEYAADAVTAGACSGVVVVGHAPSEEEGMAEAARWLTPLVPEVPVELLRAPDHFRAAGAAESGAAGAESGAAASLRAARAQTSAMIGRLTGHFDELVAASAGSNADDEHDPEGATIAFERSQLDATARRAREQLAEIDAAEARLTAGTYGVCESCGGPVGQARLDARPTARTCITCASTARPDPRR